MGFRFRNTIRITPEVRVALDPTDVSLSPGTHSATVTIGAGGEYADSGLPASGISYPTRLERSPSARRRDERDCRYRNWQKSHGDPMDANCSLDDKGNLLLHDQDGQALSNAERRTLWEQHEATLQDWLDQQMASINGDDDLMLNIHEGTPSPDSASPQFERTPFTEPEPLSPITFLPAPAPEAPTIPLQRPWHRWSGLLARRQRQQHQRAMAHWREAVAQSEAARYNAAQQEAPINAALQQRRKAWRSAKTAFESEQQRLAETFDACIRSDEGFMGEVLSAEIEHLDWPRETRIDFQIDARRLCVQLNVDIPELDAMPRRSARLGANGQRLLVKNKSQKQIRLDYARHIHGTCLRIAGAVFASLPAIKQLEISAYSPHTGTDNDDAADQYLLAMSIKRRAFSKLNFARLDQLDPVVALDKFDLRRDMTKSGLLRPIEPFGEPFSKADSTAAAID